MLFFFFLVIFNKFFIVPLARQKIKVKFALPIPASAPTIVINEIIDTPPVVALKTVKILSMSSEAATYLLNFLLHDFL